MRNCPDVAILNSLFGNVFFLSRRHSDQMSEGSQVSRVTLYVQILKWRWLTDSLTKVRYRAARAATRDPIWACQMKPWHPVLILNLAVTQFTGWVHKVAISILNELQSNIWSAMPWQDHFVHWWCCSDLGKPHARILHVQTAFCQIAFQPPSSKRTLCGRYFFAEN